MLRIRLWKSTPFRLALTFAALFIACFLLAGVAAYLAVTKDLGERLDRQILETFAGFEGLYEKSDTADIVAAIDRMATASTGHDRVYLAQSSSGRPLAGNIVGAPSVDGWATLAARTLGIDEDDLRFRVYSAPIGDVRITVGANLEASKEILESALNTFVWAMLAVLALAAGGGALLAFRVQRRIDLIGGTLDAVGEGRLDARIPITRSNDDLDRLSAQINAALDRLKELIEGMRQVSSDIAHDLKTPINRLYIAIEAARERAAEGRADAAGLTEALGEAKQVNDTFDALLRITQIESGARRSRFLPVDLVEILETVFDAYDPVAQEQGHRLSLAMPDDHPIVVFGDRELLLQMFANLTENAIRHTARGTPIRLECEVGAAADGPRVVVSDSGPGIPANKRQKVFQRLYRLESSRTTPGSGLGLSLVKAIAELHGASISLTDNAPGLRVSIVFPAQSDFPAGKLA